MEGIQTDTTGMAERKEGKVKTQMKEWKGDRNGKERKVKTRMIEWKGGYKWKRKEGGNTRNLDIRHK